MKMIKVIKLILFSTLILSILIQPTEGLLGIDYAISYVLSYIFEGLFNNLIAPGLKYMIGGPFYIVRDALTAATPILGLTLYGENGSYVAYSIIGSIIETIFSVIWWLITGSIELLVNLLTTNIDTSGLWDTFGLFLSWVPVAFSNISSFFITDVAGKSLIALQNGRSIGIESNNIINILTHKKSVDNTINPNPINECLLLVLCSIYADGDKNLLMKELEMKENYKTFVDKQSNKSSNQNISINSLKVATQFGEKYKTQRACKSRYKVCKIPLWLMRPALSTMSYEWRTSKYISNE